MAESAETEHLPIDVYEMPEESQEVLLQRIDDGTAILAFRVCSGCAPQHVLDRIEDGELDLSDGDALHAQYPCEMASPPGPAEGGGNA